MTIILDQYVVPETKGTFEIRQAITLNVTAAEAQKIAGRWLRDEVAFRLTPIEPMLVICDERVVWRVPAMYTSTNIGHVGEVGTVDVDVETEELYSSKELKDTMLDEIMVLAKTVPPFEPRKLEGEAAKWLVKDYKPTPRVESTLSPAEIIAATDKRLSAP